MLPRSLTPQQVGTGRLHARAPAAQPRRSRGASRAVRLVAHGLATSEDGLANGVMPAGEDNALETLRVTKEPGKRAELLQQLDNHFLDASLSYAPSPVEEYLIKALAPQITKYQVGHEPFITRAAGGSACLRFLLGVETALISPAECRLVCLLALTRAAALPMMAPRS